MTIKINFTFVWKRDFDIRSTIVDLPDPEGPTIALIFPILILKVIFFNIVLSLVEYLKLTFLKAISFFKFNFLIFPLSKKFLFSH